MIALLAFVAMAQGQVVESIDSTAKEISIQALIKLPALGAKDLAKLEIIARAIPKQTEDYPRREMLMVTGGQPVRCQITSDTLRIWENVAPDNLKAGLSLMESLVRRATLLQDNLDASAAEAIRADYWSSALRPIILPPVKVRQEEALELYHRVVRPERLLLAVGGKFDKGEAQENWERRMEAWNPGPPPRGYFDLTALEERTQGVGRVTTVDFIAPSWPGADAALSTKILALFAIGGGKGASMFQVVRQRHGWSYRQEALLVPTSDGWQPHVIFATMPTDELGQRIATIRAELLEDVKAWTKDDLTRALGMAESVLLRSVEFSPLYFLGDRPTDSSIEDRTFLAGYWQMKTGTAWNPQTMVSSMKQVTLEDLKDQATQILQGSKLRILSGS